ncbi:hypothetical protein ABH931_007493 [Streptacidiphilus sp. MAP12-33]|uniref:Rv1733c family protein n=1 Tax=Streptacidiphilus sp. MAP12-33 TaxID=3156266 RepID=UPI003519D11F
MLGVFAAVAALGGACAPWIALPFVVAACWACYVGALAWQAGPDLRVLALLGACALLGRVLSEPVERAACRRRTAAEAEVEANPLFRPADRRRARLHRSRLRLLVTSLVLGLAVATAVHVRDDAAADAVRRQGHAVTATTLAAAVPARTAGTAPRGGPAVVVHVPAVWEYPAGVRHTGRVTVFRRQPAGTRLTVWVDAAGRLGVTPSSAPDRIAAAALIGVSASALAVLFSGLVCQLLLRRLDLLASRAWATDWARVEPYWSGRHRNEDVGGR